MAEYRIVKIGWDNGNDGINIVLVSKKDRAQIGTDINGGVHAKKGDVKVVALVERQFREFVGQERVATINAKLATALGVVVGDTIELDGEVTESEWAAFQRTVPRVNPMDMVIRAIAQRNLTPRDPQEAGTVGGHE